MRPRRPLSSQPTRRPRASPPGAFLVAQRRPPDAGIAFPGRRIVSRDLGSVSGRLGKVRDPWDRLPASPGSLPGASGYVPRRLLWGLRPPAPDLPLPVRDLRRTADDRMKRGGRYRQSRGHRLSADSHCRSARGRRRQARGPCLQAGGQRRPGAGLPQPAVVGSHLDGGISLTSGMIRPPRRGDGNPSPYRRLSLDFRQSPP